MPNDRGGGAEGAEREPSFEAALARLESIVEDLEAGSLPLEESIARYEEGVRLSRRLTLTLDEAEKRIERLVEVGGELPTTEPMALDPAGNDAPRGEPARPRSARRPTADPPDELPF